MFDSSLARTILSAGGRQNKLQSRSLLEGEAGSWFDWIVVLFEDRASLHRSNQEVLSKEILCQPRRISNQILP